jgi:ankyrin repeat protein
MDNDVDALDAALDGIDEATSTASVRAAAVLNSVDVLRRLHRLYGAVLMHRDSYGQSALHWTCLCNSVECVRYLVQHASESASFLDADGKTHHH